mgnify:CR=1 FL=1
MDWIDWLRVLFIIGMGYGAWEAYRKMPPKIRLNGRSYYRLPDGGFATPWGRRVKDPAIVAELDRLSQVASQG